MGECDLALVSTVLIQLGGSFSLRAGRLLCERPAGARARPGRPSRGGLKVLGPPPAEPARDRSRTSLPLCTRRVYSRYGANLVNLSMMLMCTVCNCNISIFGPRKVFTPSGGVKLMWDMVDI